MCARDDFTSGRAGPKRIIAISGYPDVGVIGSCRASGVLPVRDPSADAARRRCRRCGGVTLRYRDFRPKGEARMSKPRRRRKIGSKKRKARRDRRKR